jgi:DNA repair photolyase
VAGSPVRAAQKGNRPECACFEARDIGEYDTCPHGCVYCYAVRNRPLAQKRYAQHDPAGEFLFPPLNLPDSESGPDEPFQIVMFE